jgi:hypothetical protein
MADVFISYARDDSETANQLARELEARGISVFFDKGVLVAGTDFRQEIAQALRAAKAVVVLLSANTKRSSWVQEELSSVIERADGPNVIPVLLDSHAKENWVWPLVSDRHAFDLSTRRERIGEVALQVSRLLPNESLLRAPPSVEAAPKRSSRRGIFLILALSLAVAAISTIFLLPELTSAPPPEGSAGSPSNLWLWVSPVSAAIGFVFGYLFSKWRR